MDFSGLKIHNPPTDEQLIDWNFLLEKGYESNAPWVQQLQANIAKLHDLNTQAIQSAKLLSSDQVISHRDLDPKNVIWGNDNPIIIDPEFPRNYT
jgi:Ser/Thr protein kinase RdoA (MazF antagonist)